MDYDMFITVITTVGFPIVACGAMFWFMCTKIDALTEAVKENTIATNRLADK